MGAKKESDTGNPVDRGIHHERDLVRVGNKEASAYDSESLASLTIYSLYWLHKWELRRSIEAVAVLNWRLFPAKFCMVGFQQFPDAFRTNRSLLQGQPKYRNWLTGSAKSGFNLNQRGIQIAETLTKRLGPPSLDDGTMLGSEEPTGAQTVEKTARTIEPARVISEIRSSTLYEKWLSQTLGERDLIHVHSLLGVFDHTPARVRTRKMKELQRCAEDVGDEEIQRFLEDIRQEFPIASK